MLSQREKFINARPLISHSEFLVSLQVPDRSQDFVIAVRETLGLYLNLPPFIIYPTDTLQTLKPFFPFNGWDDMEFIVTLEGCGVEFGSDEIQEQIPRFIDRRFFWIHHGGVANFGEWAIAVSEYLICNECYIPIS
jgi:hypothetical protein